MMLQKLTLAEGGIFPITRNQHGELLSALPNTGISLPGTIQGEGKLAGTSALFIRLATCNLRCVWRTSNGEISPCDTPFASFQIDHPITLRIVDLIDILRHNLGLINHIVISGGEPLLQADVLEGLCRAIKQEFNVHITLETNGTIMSEAVLQYVDLLSVSPKLSGSNPTHDKLQVLGIEPKGAFNLHAKLRINTVVLAQMVLFIQQRNSDLQFKFVVASQEDALEIKELLSQLPAISASDVLIMPLGANVEQLNQARSIALEMVVLNGWRYSPRLHIDIFGSKHGV